MTDKRVRSTSAEESEKALASGSMPIDRPGRGRRQGFGVPAMRHIQDTQKQPEQDQFRSSGAQGFLEASLRSSDLANFTRLDGKCSGDAEFLDLVAEGIARNTQQLRRTGLVVVGALQGLLDQVLLQLLE